MTGSVVPIGYGHLAYQECEIGQRTDIQAFHPVDERVRCVFIHERFVILSCPYDLSGYHSCYDANKVSPQTVFYLADRPSKYSQTLSFNTEHISSSKGSQIAYDILHNTNTIQSAFVRPHLE